MPIRTTSFAPPPAPAARGCLAAVAVAGALALAALGTGSFVAGTYALAHAARPSRLVAPVAAPAPDLAAARRRWGAIRASFPGTHRKVPA